MNNQNLRTTAHEILIADACVKDLNKLLDGLKEGVNVWLVQQDEDAVAKIIKALALPHLKTLHLLAHGAPGQINLGGKAITANDFRSRFDGAAERDLDIAFWSCNTGAGDVGQSFVKAVAETTGARVAAAQGLVGNAQKGGSWGLPVSISAPFSAGAQRIFEGVLGLTGSGTLLDPWTGTGAECADGAGGMSDGQYVNIIGGTNLDNANTVTLKVGATHFTIDALTDTATNPSSSPA